jgi:hypothetical protein
VGWLLHVHHQQICPRLMLDELECWTYLIDVQQSAELARGCHDPHPSLPPLQLEVTHALEGLALLVLMMHLV